MLSALREPAGGLTAVICADDAAAGLAGVAAAAGARLIPVSAARGLEFDGVVVVDAYGIVEARPGGHRDLYVALTRATRRLTVLVAGAQDGDVPDETRADLHMHCDPR